MKKESTLFCMFSLIIASSIHAMYYEEWIMERDGTRYPFDKDKAVKVIRIIERSPDSAATAQDIIDKKPTMPLLNAAIALQAPRAVNALLHAGAPIADKVDEEYPMDIALRIGFKHAITLLVTHPSTERAKVKYYPDTFSTCNFDALLHFCTLYYTKNKSVDKHLQLTTFLLDNCNDIRLKAIARDDLLYVPESQHVQHDPKTLLSAFPLQRYLKAFSYQTSPNNTQKEQMLCTYLQYYARNSDPNEGIRNMHDTLRDNPNLKLDPATADTIRSRISVKQENDDFSIMQYIEKFLAASCYSSKEDDSQVELLVKELNEHCMKE